MKSIKKMLLMFTVIIATTITVSSAQIPNSKTETFKVYGNCDMCKAAIEKAGKTKAVSKVDWNKDTKMATITYNDKKTDKDAVLKNIALAGYDSDSFLAPGEAYNNLPGCCKYDRVNKSVAKGMTEMARMDTMTKATATNVTNTLQPVYDAYFSIKDALVGTDGNAAAAKAGDLQAAIMDVKMEKLAMDVHMVWMKVLKDLNTDAEKIHGTNNVAQQRGYFTTLSQNVYSLIKISKSSETVYYDHCPMYNNGKGADWLSKEAAITNPYYGSMMMSCGKTLETIK